MEEQPYRLLTEAENREFFKALPREVRAKRDLPEELIVAVERFLNRYAEHPDGLISIDYPPWPDYEKEPSKRELRAVLTSLSAAQRALRRLPGPTRYTVMDFIGVEEEDLYRILGKVAAATSKQLARAPAKRRRGRPKEGPRKTLEHDVAGELARAGIRVAKSRSGTYARVLLAVYKTAGLPVPGIQSRSFFTVLKREGDYYTLVPSEKPGAAWMFAGDVEILKRVEALKRKVPAPPKVPESHD